jgi:hypothetical protein
MALFLKFTRLLKELFNKIQREGTLPGLLYEASLTLLPKPDADIT